MPATLAVILLAVGWLVAADWAMPFLPAVGGRLRRPHLIERLGMNRGGAPPAANVPVTPSLDESSTRDAERRMRGCFEDLARGRRRRLRIAHLGDSIIEGDLITADLRAGLQRRFGGRGAGLVDLASPLADLRQTVRVTGGPGWRHWQIGPNAPMPSPCGLGGTVAMVPENPADAWVRLFAGAGRWKQDLPAADLYYGRPPRPGAVVRCSSAQGSAEAALNGAAPVNRVRLLSKASPWLDVRFRGAAGVPLYGISIESAQGVIVDNFSLRGCSGGELASLDAGILERWHAVLPYDVIVLHFGLNVAYPKPGDYHLYALSLRRSLQHLQAAFPGTVLVVVSSSDRAERTDAGLATAAHLPYVITAQHTAAAAAGAAWFDLFAAMGGAGTMTRWVAANPPLAWKDYMHFNERGSRIVAEDLDRFLTGSGGAP